MMTPEQILQITQIAFVLILFIPSLVTVGVLIVVAYKFLPVMIRQVQQLIDNNTQLTKIADQNAKQVSVQQLAVEQQTIEMKKQTVAIDAQTTEIRTQTLDFRNYQTLVSDSIDNHTTQIEVLQTTMANLPQQVIDAIEDRLKCAGILQEIQALRYEVSQVLSQQKAKRATGTGTIPVVKLDSETS